MKRREFNTLFGGATVAWPLSARAQQATPVIGFLGSISPAAVVRPLATFRQALKETGFEEGKTLAIEYRWAEFSVVPPCQRICNRRSFGSGPLTTVISRISKRSMRLRSKTALDPDQEVQGAVRTVFELFRAGLLTGACCISSRCGWNAPWKKPTIEEGRHARPRLGTTGAASRKVHPSHHCWRIYTCAGSSDAGAGTDLRSRRVTFSSGSAPSSETPVTPSP